MFNIKKLKQYLAQSLSFISLSHSFLFFFIKTEILLTKFSMLYICKNLSAQVPYILNIFSFHFAVIERKTNKLR